MSDITTDKTWKSTMASSRAMAQRDRIIFAAQECFVEYGLLNCI